MIWCHLWFVFDYVFYYDICLLLVTLAGLRLTGTLLFVPQVKGRKRSTNHEYGERGATCTCWARPAVDQPAVILLGLHYDVIKHLSLDD